MNKNRPFLILIKFKILCASDFLSCKLFLSLDALDTVDIIYAEM